MFIKCNNIGNCNLFSFNFYKNKTFIYLAGYIFEELEESNG